MSLAISLRSELLKSKRTSVVYFTVFAAAFGPFMSLLDLVFDGIDSEDPYNIFSELMINKFQMTGAVALPFYIILVCTLLPQIEYKNNTWKQLLSSPQRKLNIFLAKFVNVQLFIILFLLLNRLMMFIVVVILHFREPELNVLSQPVEVSGITMSLFNSYIAMLAVCSIQFWLGLRCRNFIIPVAIGISLWFLGSILVMEIKSPLANYFPYSFHMFKIFPDFKVNANNIRIASLAYTLIFLAIGFLSFSKREK